MRGMVRWIVASYRLAELPSRGVVKRPIASRQVFSYSSQGIRVQRLLLLRAAGRVVNVEFPVTAEMEHLIDLLGRNAIFLHPPFRRRWIAPVAFTFASPRLALVRRGLDRLAKERQRGIYGAATVFGAKSLQSLDDCRQRG